MRDVLIFITVEWRGVVMLSWFVFIIFVFYCVLHIGLRRLPQRSLDMLEGSKNLFKWMSWYGSFFFIFCHYGMSLGLNGARSLLATFPDAADIGMVWICLNTAYLLMICCFCGLFAACSPNGLRLARFSLLSLPFPNVVLPFFCYRLGAARSGGVFTWDDFWQLRSTTPLWPITAVAVVFLLYLCCSSELKRFWAELKKTTG